MGTQKLSKEQELQLVEDYKAGESVQSLMAKYGFASKKSITDKVKKYYPTEYQTIIEIAQNNRKTYNYCLKEIQNEFDAYYLGLLLTDGYINRNTDIGIDLTDEDCIQFLSKTIGKEYKTYAPSSGNLDTEGKKERHRLIFSNVDMVHYLERLGVVPNKSSILKGPELTSKEEQFIPYIIRGIIDGDGCIYTTSYGAPAFYIITKSKDFAQWLEEILTQRLYMKNIHINIDKNGLYRIETAEQTNIQKLIILCYDKPYGMSRKYKLLRKTFRDYNNDALII